MYTALPRILFISCLLIPSCATASEARVEILPTTITLHYDASMGRRIPVAAIETPRHSLAYTLTFEPDFEDDGYPDELSLALYRPGHDTPLFDNLFDGDQEVLGYQPIDFAATDFKAGPDRSIYGRWRELVIPKFDLDVWITVEKVTVSPAPSPYFDEIDELDVKVTVQNLTAKPIQGHHAVPSRSIETVMSR